MRRSVLNSNSSYDESSASKRKTSINSTNSNPTSVDLHAGETKIANILYNNTLRTNSSVPKDLKSCDTTQTTVVTTSSPRQSPRNVSMSKMMLKKQLTINSDRNSLSSIVNESVYK